MRRHAHRLATHRDEDVARREPRRQLGRDAAGEAQAEVMPGAAMRRDAADAELSARPLGDRVGAAAERRVKGLSRADGKIFLEKYNRFTMKNARQLQYKALRELEKISRRRNNGKQWKKQCAEQSEQSGIRASADVGLDAGRQGDGAARESGDNEKARR